MVYKLSLVELSEVQSSLDPPSLNLQIKIKQWKKKTMNCSALLLIANRMADGSPSYYKPQSTAQNKPIFIILIISDCEWEIDTQRAKRLHPAATADYYETHMRWWWLLCPWTSTLYSTIYVSNMIAIFRSFTKCDKM